MKRISSNESFPRNIILSIDPKEENYSSNLVSFRKYFQKALEEGKNPQEAVEFASSRIKSLVEKRKQIFIPKPGNKRDFPVLSEPETEDKTPYSTKEFLEEGSAFARDQKEKRKQSIIKRLVDGTGVESPEDIEALWQRFTVKRKSRKSDDVGVKATINEYLESKRTEPKEEEKAPTSEQIQTYLNIIKALDPSKYENNLVIFERAINNGMSVADAFERVHLLIRARKFMRENGIAVNPINSRIFIANGENFEKSLNTIRKRDSSGQIPLEQDTLSYGNSEDTFINYNGERVSLKRLTYLLFGNNTLRTIKYAYANLSQLIFERGYSVDEAVHKVSKLVNASNRKREIVSIFPGNEEMVYEIFKDYYIDDDLSFEEALEKTKDDVFNPSN